MPFAIGRDCSVISRTGASGTLPTYLSFPSLESSSPRMKDEDKSQTLLLRRRGRRASIQCRLRSATRRRVNSERGCSGDCPRTRAVNSPPTRKPGYGLGGSCGRRSSALDGSLAPCEASGLRSALLVSSGSHGLHFGCGGSPASARLFAETLRRALSLWSRGSPKNLNTSFFQNREWSGPWPVRRPSGGFYRSIPTRKVEDAAARTR